MVCINKGTSLDLCSALSFCLDSGVKIALKCVIFDKHKGISLFYVKKCLKHVNEIKRKAEACCHFLLNFYNIPSANSNEEI